MEAGEVAERYSHFSKQIGIPGARYERTTPSMAKELRDCVTPERSKRSVHAVREHGEQRRVFFGHAQFEALWWKVSPWKGVLDYQVADALNSTCSAMKQRSWTIAQTSPRKTGARMRGLTVLPG